MKPTSIIFLILSLVLVLVGVICCVVGTVSAKNNDVSLFFDQSIDNGDSMNTYSANKISNIDICLQNCNVNIYGTQDKSHIDVIDFSNKAYDLTLQGGNLTIKNSDVFSLFTSIKINEAGFGYTGLRGYLSLNKYPAEKRTINIFVNTESLIQTINLDVNSGNVEIKDLSVLSDVDVLVNSGNVSFNNFNCYSKLSSKVHSGNIIVNTSHANESIFEIEEKGDVKTVIDRQQSFMLSCASGFVYIEDEKTLAEYNSVYPSGIISEDINSTVDDTSVDTVPVFTNNPLVFTGKVNKGNIYISTIKSDE